MRRALPFIASLLGAACVMPVDLGGNFGNIDAGADLERRCTSGSDLDGELRVRLETTSAGKAATRWNADGSLSALIGEANGSGGTGALIFALSSADGGSTNAQRLSVKAAIPCDAGGWSIGNPSFVTTSGDAEISITASPTAQPTRLQVEVSREGEARVLGRKVIDLERRLPRPEEMCLLRQGGRCNWQLATDAGAPTPNSTCETNMTVPAGAVCRPLDGGLEVIDRSSGYCAQGSVDEIVTCAFFNCGAVHCEGGSVCVAPNTCQPESASWCATGPTDPLASTFRIRRKSALPTLTTLVRHDVVFEIEAFSDRDSTWALEPRLVSQIPGARVWVDGAKEVFIAKSQPGPTTRDVTLSFVLEAHVTSAELVLGMRLMEPFASNQGSATSKTETLVVGQALPVEASEIAFFSPLVLGAVQKLRPGAVVVKADASPPAQRALIHLTTRLQTPGTYTTGSPSVSNQDWSVEATGSPSIVTNSPDAIFIMSVIVRAVTDAKDAMLTVPLLGVSGTTSEFRLGLKLRQNPCAPSPP